MVDDNADKAKIEKLLNLLKSAQQAIASLKAENEKLKGENATLREKLRQVDTNKSEATVCEDEQTTVLSTAQQDTQLKHLQPGQITNKIDTPKPNTLDKLSPATTQIQVGSSSNPRRSTVGTTVSRKPRFIRGFECLLATHNDGPQDLEPAKKAHSLLLALDESNYGTVAKLFLDIPVMVFRRAFLVFLLDAVNNESSRKHWLLCRKQGFEGSMPTDFPTLPAELSDKVNLIIKFVCAIAASGRAGYPIAIELMNRLLHHLMAVNRNQYHFPWVPFFFGNTTGVWHHLFNWQAFCGSLHLPTAKPNDDDQQPLGDIDTILLEPNVHTTFPRNASDAAINAVVVETLLNRELQDFVVTHILIKSAILMESSDFLHKMFDMLLYCTSIGSSPGILLAILNHSDEICKTIDASWFYQVLLTWSVHLDDFQESLQPAMQEIHVIQKPSSLIKAQFVMDWISSSCDRIRTTVHRILEKQNMQRIPDEVRKDNMEYNQTISLCDQHNLHISLIWQRFGFLTIFYGITDASIDVLPATIKCGSFEDFSEPLDSVFRFMRELMSFDLKSSSVCLSNILNVNHDNTLDARSDTEQDLIDHFHNAWSSVDPSKEDLNKLLTQILELIVKPCSCFIDSSMRGWRGGNTGDGIRLFVSLQTRIGIIQDHLSNLAKLLGAEASAFVRLPQNTTTSSYFLREFSKYSTYDLKNLEQVIQLIDRSNVAIELCLKNQRWTTAASDVLENCDTPDVTTSPVGKQISSICRKLQKVSFETVAYVGLSIVENMLFAILCNIRGLLRHLVASNKDNGWKSSLQICKDIIISCSAMCGNSNDNGILDEIHEVSLLLANGDPKSLRIPLNYPSEVRRLTKCLIPAFVINLDKRPDRWKRMTSMGERAGLRLIRIPAVDGTTGDMGLDVSIDQEIRIGVDFLNVPENDVASTWNTALNSKFDSGCAPDVVASLTASEKACAASHLKIWRAIDAFRTSQGTTGESAPWVHCRDLFRSNIALPKQLTSNDQLIKIVDDELDCYVILEDDADIKSYAELNFRSEILRMIKKAALSDWDIIYLGGVTPSKSSHFQGFPVKGGHFMKVNYIWMLHAYLIKGSTVSNKLLKSLPIVGPIDNYLATLIYNGALIAYALGDFIVDQSAGRMTDRLSDTNVVRSGVSSTTTVAGYRQILDKRKLPHDNSDRKDCLDSKRSKKDEV